VKDVNCSTDCRLECQLSTWGFCPKETNVNADDITTQIGRLESLTYSQASLMLNALTNALARSGHSDDGTLRMLDWLADDLDEHGKPLDQDVLRRLVADSDWLVV
jgi:hypothetical protein